MDRVFKKKEKETYVINMSGNVSFECRDFQDGNVILVYYLALKTENCI